MLVSIVIIQICLDHKVQEAIATQAAFLKIWTIADKIPEKWLKKEEAKRINFHVEFLTQKNALARNFT